MADRPPQSRWRMRAALFAIPMLMVAAGAWAPPAGAATGITTTATSSITPSSVNYGDSVTYSITVTAAGGTTPFGYWYPTIGDDALCAPSALSNGHGTCTSTSAPAGAEVVTAVFEANATYAGSTSNADLTVNVPPPPPPYGATGSSSGAGTDQTGSFTVTQGSLVVQGNGPGSITASNFSANPTSVPLSTSTGVYDNVELGHGSNFFSVLIAVCNEGAGASLQWFNGTSWQPFSIQSNHSGCLYGLVGQSDSSPVLSQLANTPIGVSVLGSPAATPGYWLTASDGGVFSFNRPFYGSTGSLHLNQPIVAMAATHDDGGYWLAAADGGIFAFGDARFAGSLPYEGKHTAKVVDIVGDPANFGYLLIESDGTVWDFGGVPSFGDLPFFGIHVNNIVGGAMTPDGRGLYLVSSTGKVYVLSGDGVFAGDASGLTLNAPVIAMSVDPQTGGYWLLAKDGGVFSFNAPFYGSTGNLRLNQPVVGMTATADGGGYWFVAADGGVFSFGDATFEGSTGTIRLNRPVVGMAGG